jgi:dipeptidyl aminopeptidase/acylaminoacyl peptidase
LTLPPSADHTNLPAVVFPGGANSFERYDFDVLGHFLAMRGFAVFHAGQRQNLTLSELYEAGEIEGWVQTTHDDLAQAINALAAAGVVDKGRVCILGAYNDGYLAVIGAALRPEQYACAIDLFGIVDLKGVMRNYSFTRAPMTFMYYPTARHWSDYDEDELERFSPLSHVDVLDTPLLLIERTNSGLGRFGFSWLGVGNLVRALKQRDREVVWINYDSQEYAENQTVQKNMFREIGDFLDAHIGH